MSRINDRPEAPDFYWFIKDLVRVATEQGYRYGFNHKISSFESYRAFARKEASLREWIKQHVSNYLKIQNLQETWGSYIRGDISGSSVNAQYCFDKLIKPFETEVDPEKKDDPNFPSNRTEGNSQALSTALRNILPQEKRRHLKIKIDLDSSEWLPQEEAAKILGISDRWIRALAEEGSLTRHPNGKISARSIRDYQEGKSTS